MKFTRRKGDESMIRKVWSDDKEVMFGIVGPVGDLLDAGIFDYCDYSREAWAYIPDIGIMQTARFGATREEVLAGIRDHREDWGRPGAYWPGN